MNYCGFCGLEVLQLCFCHGANFKLMIKYMSTEGALQFRIKHYDAVLKTINASDAWLTREPGYNAYRIIYDGWLNYNVKNMRFV